MLDIEKLELPSLDLRSDSIDADRSWNPPTSAVATSMLDMEKLSLPSFEDYSNSVAADRLWSYTGAVGPPTEVRKLIHMVHNYRDLIYWRIPEVVQEIKTQYGNTHNLNSVHLRTFLYVSCTV